MPYVTYVVRCAIWYHLYKWYQIAQRTTYFRYFDQLFSEMEFFKRRIFIFQIYNPHNLTFLSYILSLIKLFVFDYWNIHQLESLIKSCIKDSAKEYVNQSIWHANFLPLFCFNGRTFSRRVASCWSHGPAKYQVQTYQNPEVYCINL